MARLADPTISFFIVIAIGIVVGWLMERFVRTSWLSKQIAGRNRVVLTGALVGIAGAFIGFHVATLAKLGAGAPYVPLIAAAIGAALVVWGWKVIKI